MPSVLMPFQRSRTTPPLRGQSEQVFFSFAAMTIDARGFNHLLSRLIADSRETGQERRDMEREGRSEGRRSGRLKRIGVEGH